MGELSPLHWLIVIFIIVILFGGKRIPEVMKGMGEGVEKALVDVAIKKGNLSLKEAEEFWRLKKEAGQYIAEIW